MKTTTEELYADQQTGLREAIAIVIGKRANGIPLNGFREEFAAELIALWVDAFGMESL